MPFNIHTQLWMRFPELRSSPPRKVISEGVAMSAAFDLTNISEKKFPFFEEGRRKKGLCRYFRFLFLFPYLIHWGRAELAAIKWSGPRTLQRRE